jgi:hypothetical protein
MSKEFPEIIERLPQVTIFWGAGVIDRTGENQWDPVFIGELSFD